MKRFTIALTFTALLAVTTAHAGWWRTFGGEGNDEGKCVQETVDGNYIVTGQVGNNLWLFKTDTNGNIIWLTTIEEGWSWGNWVEQTIDEGFIIAGGPNLLKTDSNGDSVWAYDYGVMSRCVHETSDGGYVITGEIGDSPLVLLRIDTEGSEVWRKTYSIPEHNVNEGYFVRQTSDDGYIITGVTGITNEETNQRWLWLIRTDSQGDSLWARTYGGEDTQASIGDQGRCVRELEDGGFIVCGYRSPGGLWLLRTDDLGDTIWTKTFGGGQGYCVDKTIDSGFIITGGTKTGIFHSTPQLSDLRLIRTDSVGDTLWTRTYGGMDADVGLCVHQTSDYGFIVSGTTWSFGNGKDDIYLLKTDSLGLLTIKEEPFTNTSPVWELISKVGQMMLLCFTNSSEEFTVYIFDVSGQKLDVIRSSQESGLISWGEGYPPGVYYIKALDNTNHEKSVKVVLTD